MRNSDGKRGFECACLCILTKVTMNKKEFRSWLLAWTGFTTGGYIWLRRFMTVMLSMSISKPLPHNIHEDTVAHNA
jgi:hypothetical protein